MAYGSRRRSGLHPAVPRSGHSSLRGLRARRGHARRRGRTMTINPVGRTPYHRSRAGRSRY